MIAYPIKKLIHGYCSIRSYIVKEAIRRNESVCIHLGDEKMVLTPQELKNYKQFYPEKIQSRFAGSYELYDYKWIPEKQGRLELYRIK